MNTTGQNEFLSLSFGNQVVSGYATHEHHHDFIARDYQCPSGKDVYLTYEDAKRAQQLRPSRLREKAIYKCHICGHFHLTTKNGVDRRPKVYNREQNKLMLKRALESCTEERLSHAKRACPQSYGIIRSTNGFGPTIVTV